MVALHVGLNKQAFSLLVSAMISIEATFASTEMDPLVFAAWGLDNHSGSSSCLRMNFSCREFILPRTIETQATPLIGNENLVDDL